MGACNGKSDPPIITEATNTQNAVADVLDKTDSIEAEEPNSHNGDNQEVVCSRTLTPSMIEFPIDGLYRRVQL